MLMFEVDNPSKVYLIEANKLQKTVKPQYVQRSVLNESVQPYTWDEELNKNVYTKEEMLHALLREGHITKEDLDFRALLVELLKNGKLPIVDRR